MKWVLGISIIAIGMGWAATATIPAAAVSVDEASFKFLPPETQAIAFIDVAALRSAPLVQDALQAVQAKDGSFALPNDVAEFTRATGVDPMRDIDKVTLAKIGPKDGFAVVQGRI